MRKGQVSQTALKVALNLITLNRTKDWSDRLPDGLADLTERLLLAAKVPMYGPRTVAASKRPLIIRFYEAADLMMPGQFEGFGRRKCFMDAQVRAALDAGVRQVLILGAGFDTLALRLGPQFPDVHFFELDHPATSAAKRKAVDEVGKPGNVTLIAADLAETALSKVMAKRKRWDASAPSMFVAEGLLMYLSESEVRTLFRETAACAGPMSRIAFSHCTSDWWSSPGGRLGRAAVRLAGEPFRSSVTRDSLPDLLAGTGWRVSDTDDDAAHGIELYAVAERTGGAASA